ncbi:uncharacterized protein SPPG_01205 [Spizellomyces punctatus DAOM BR117]|uniref:Uncharacterized protein n=1 Tax=Spizellomyces punctatus (strain DAOM BR117) TaxID=645134 RepID=A0A0L0HSC4_SPIPD|nr:uncharacterized protein SPPG_01205 [Spizellomyces punctatus DAOM BR117]KND03749.1 hypothetical protein SPPG_01205 [Spizellomyces punctatus DAOM BR117]|eukprot:XP_016611788.1 hypothetical protein SPPG_01205 [Spizellomyces punctatus DAOM BR117]
MSTWENVKKHTRRLSDGFRRSPIKEKPAYFTPQDDDPIHLQLGEAHLIYEGNEWMLDGPVDAGSGRASQALHDLSEKNRILEAENQLLKFKIAVLTDMLAGTKLDMLQLQAHRS